MAEKPDYHPRYGGGGKPWAVRRACRLIEEIVGSMTEEEKRDMFQVGVPQKEST